MDAESTYELQKIDCNCNNCIHMQRDLVKWQKWHDWHKAIELAEFEKAKVKAIANAEAINDAANRHGMLRVAHKMRFQFDKFKLISYGHCTKLDKPASFLPNVCQIETQTCFLHRKDNVS